MPIVRSGSTLMPGDGAADDERADALRPGRAGAREDDVDAAHAGVADEALLPVEEPHVAVALGARLERRRVGADARLGQRVRAVHRAVDEGRQPPPLLLLTAGEHDRQRDELHIGRHQRNRPRHLRELLDEGAERDLGLAAAAVLHRHGEREEALARERAVDVVRVVAVLVDLAHARTHLVEHHAAQVLTERSLLVGQPPHAPLLPVRRSCGAITRMDAVDPRARLTALLGFAIPERPPTLQVVAREVRAGYVEHRVAFAGAEGDVPAFLLLPFGAGPFAGVVAHHQHNSEWHWGKSEVAGRAGNPLQAFGPALARRGVAVLAPDAVGFEDRRATGPGIEPDDRDGPQHFNEMSYRLVAGRLLMTTVLGDAAAALSALRAHPAVDADRVGVVGHSYGGNTTLFHAALDERLRFAAASGAACTYRRRMADRTGIELAQIVPGIVEVADIDDVAGLIAPRPLLLVSAPKDPYSADADAIEAAVADRFPAGALQHARFPGGHALTPERFGLIVDWLAARAAA
jgi:dienelactone hydrolase